MRLLIVAHDFPPLDSLGARRPYSWARYWTDAGHDVHVLTTRKYSFNKLAPVPYWNLDGITVHEADYLPGRAPATVAAAGPATPAPRGLRAACINFLRVSTRGLRSGLGFFADPTFLAHRALFDTGVAVLNQKPFDAIISCWGPDASVKAAHALSSKTGVRWVADYRDVWDQKFADQWFAITSWLVGLMHTRMLRQASAVSAVSEGQAAYLRQRVRCPVWVVYNGYFEELGRDVAPLERPEGEFLIVHTGIFFRSKRNPDVFFAGLALTMRDLDARQLRPRVWLLGPDEPWVREQVAAYGLQDVVEFRGQRPYQEALAAQRGADLLLFVDWMDPEGEGMLTGKLFEYLSTGRPILCVASRASTEASRLIADCATGKIVRDAEAVRAALSALLQRPGALAPDEEKIRTYTRRAQALRMLHLIAGLPA